jgi:catechol 2,3-dioxygenase-like lactoylglutathione lyase family enzyme
MHIQSLELVTADLATQYTFYTQMLGIPAIRSSESQFTLAVGATQLTFTQAEACIHQPYHFAFNIPPQQFAEAKAWLAERTPLVVSPDGIDEYFSEGWNAHNCYFLDAERNILELIARHTLDVPADKPFSAQSLLQVSEIGLVSDDVPATVQYLQEEYALTGYREGSAEFSPVGDENGLLIVVKRGRLWFAVENMPAASAPLRVEMVVQGRVRELIWE